MITYVTEAHYVDGYRLAVTFNTGESAVVDFSRLIAETTLFAPLRDVGQFKSFYLDGWPTLAWPCGLDIAPEALYQMATGKLPAWMMEAASAETALSHA
ncbi:MAG: DUF2442 domain-containing protein [Nitrosomonadales bacterium]|nr:DUF2442 domain-containing protein [Nitrosomonadales bacterium]